MRILVATGLYPPDIGGPATHTVFLETHATRLGLELIVVPFGRVRKYPPIIRHVLYLALLLFRSRGADCIYALDTISVGVPGFVASVITRKPFMLRVPGDYAWEQGQQRYGVTETLDEFRTHTEHPVGVRALSMLQSWVARHATSVIVPSEYMKEVVCGWGVSEERITRVYSVLKAIDVSSTHEEIRSEEFVITTAARLVPWKGIDTLIRVVKALRGKGIPTRLNIVGDGVCRNALVAQVRALHLEEWITFHGAVPRDVLGGILVRSNVFVLNTSYEGLSHQLLEAMHLGVPIVTTAVGGNGELITHGETGLLVPFNDEEALETAIRTLHADDALARSLRDRARASLERFTEDRIIVELDTLFKQL